MIVEYIRYRIAAGPLALFQLVKPFYTSIQEMNHYSMVE
jgi:hypothetical protein